MRKLICTILFFIPFFCFATVYTYGIHSGNIVLTASSTSPSLVAGDRLIVTGSFGSISCNSITGAINNNITIDLSGATISSSGYDQPRWYNLHYVTIIGGYWHNYYGTNFMGSLIDNFVMNGQKAVNDLGNYINQPIFQFYDQYDSTYSASMRFTGSLSQTFHNILIKNGTFRGFENTGVLIFGSGWGGGLQDKRAILIDSKIDSCYFANITNSYFKNPTPGAKPDSLGTGFDVIFGTGWKDSVTNCKFDSIAYYRQNGLFAGNAHISDVAWFGDLYGNANTTNREYASAFRVYSSGWSGLPGYIGVRTPGDTVGAKIKNGIHTNQFSYSPLEFSQNGLGNRTPANGVFPARWYADGNAVMNTVIHSYNPTGSQQPGVYHGSIIDVTNSDTGRIYNNYIINPDKDTTYNPGLINYIWAQISGAPVAQIVQGNKPYQTFTTALLVDTFAFVPAIGSDLLSGGVPGTGGLDRNGQTRISGTIGPVMRVTGSPPPCAVNTSPADGSILLTTTTATLVWNAASTATSYDVYVGGAFYSNTTSTTINLTGLTPNTGYLWYVVPIGPGGSPANCNITNNSSFQTAALPVPSCTTNIIPADGSTVASQTTATLTWNAATGSPTGYKVYLYVNGASIPSSPSYITPSTSQVVVGLTGGTMYKWFVTPYNASGDASGCATSATIFTTTAPVVPTYQVWRVFRQ